MSLLKKFRTTKTEQQTTKTVQTKKTNTMRRFAFISAMCLVFMASLSSAFVLGTQQLRKRQDLHLHKGHRQYRSFRKPTSTTTIFCSSSSSSSTVNSVAANAPLYAGVLLLQLLPGLPMFADGNRFVCLTYFWGTAVLAIAASSQRPRLDGNPGLSTTSALLAPIISSVALFSLYSLLKYTDFDPGLIYRLLVSTLGFASIQELSAEGLALLLPPSAKSALDDTAIARFFDSSHEQSQDDVVNVFGPVEELGALFISSIVIAAYFLLPLEQAFPLSNIIALSVAISTLPLLDLRTFFVGSAFLVGLLSYDFFWVFRTDVMMTVATTIEAPVKFEFPSGDPSRPFSILGLGDVVIPGSFVALMRDLDGAMLHGGDGVDEKARAVIPRNGPYFKSSLAGYGLGLAATFVANEVTKAGQPALVYLVPLVLGTTILTAAVRGEAKEVVTFRATRSEKEVD